MAYEIRHDLDPSEIPLGVPRGRPRGRGKNQLILNKLIEDDPKSCIWMIDRKRGDRIIDSAKRHGIRLKTKLVKDSETGRYKYIIWRLSNEKNNED